MNRRSRPRTLARPQLETLESRRLLAVFGTPWPEARTLTASFPADGTEIGVHGNELRGTLDTVTETQQWQELALRALQTWAYHVDINIGLRADHDLPFGSPGLTVGDPRFGDFRFGALPQPGVLANALPFQITAGTFSGSILLNSESGWSYHEWADGMPPEPDPEGTSGHDLFTVWLHEAGNALGLADNQDESSVMFWQYSGPKGLLTPSDIDELVSLYGARSDPYEQEDNSSIATATLIPVPVDFEADADVIETWGSLSDADDVDVYRFSPVSGQQEVRISLRASGVSLLQSRVEVLDAWGRSLADGSAVSVFDNDITIDVSGLRRQPELFIRVSAKDDSVYSVGDYRLVLDYRSAAVRASDPVPGAYDGGIESLWTHFELEDWEVGENDTLASATEMPGAAGDPAGRRFQVLSSLAGGSEPDIDYWRVTSPENVSGPLVVHVSPVGLTAPDLRVRILDASGTPIGTAGRLRPDGTWTVEVSQPQSDAEYFVRVAVDPGSAVDVGNYVASAHFESPSGHMSQLVSRSISSDVDDFLAWTVHKTKLYRFDLGAEDTDSDARVQVILYDAHTREIRMRLMTPAGGRRVAIAMLPEGDYIIRLSAISPSGVDIEAIGLDLSVHGLSDNLGPYDPYQSSDYWTPDYDAHYYNYYPPPEEYYDYEFFDDTEYNYTYFDYEFDYGDEYE